MPIYGHTGLIRHPRSTITYNGAMDSSGIKERVYNAWYLGNPCCCREYTINAVAFSATQTLQHPLHDWTIIKCQVGFAFTCSGKFFDKETETWKYMDKFYAQPGLGSLGLGECLYDVCPKCPKDKICAWFGDNDWPYNYSLLHALSNWQEANNYEIIDVSYPHEILAFSYSSIDYDFAFYEKQDNPERFTKIVDCYKNIDITERINHYLQNDIRPLWTKPDNLDCSLKWDGWMTNEENAYMAPPVTAFDLGKLNVQIGRSYWDSFNKTIYINRYPPEGCWMIKYENEQPRWLYDGYADPVGYKPIDLWDIFGIDSQKRCSVQQAQLI